MIKISNPTNYNFETINNLDYICTLTTDLENRAIKALYNNLSRLKRLRCLNQILIPPNCYNYLLLCFKFSLSEIEKELKKEGYGFKTKNIKKAYFFKNGKIWSLTAEFSGIYYNEADK